MIQSGWRCKWGQMTRSLGTPMSHGTSACHRESQAIHHPDEIALDYNAELFLSVFGVPLHNFYLRRGEVRVRPFEQPVCFGHGNGASNTAIYVAIIQTPALKSLLRLLINIGYWHCFLLYDLSLNVILCYV